MNYSTFSSTSARENITEIAPSIIGEVAHELLPHRPHYETANEIRFGTKGSFSVDKNKGTYFDYEDWKGGGLLDMICLFQGYATTKEAIDWLREKGFLNNTFVSQPRPASRRPNPPKSNDSKMFDIGQKIWSESETISFAQSHPVRLWSACRDLFRSYKDFPNTIRWHAKKRFIVVALSPFQDFLSAYPESPKPQQFHLIAINSKGNKRMGFKGNTDKRTYGRSKSCCVACFGDPRDGSIAIAEGIADALALTHDFPTTLACLTTFQRIANDSQLVDAISTKQVFLCSDNDQAGKQAEQKLITELGKRDAETYFIPEPKSKDPASARKGDIDE